MKTSHSLILSIGSGVLAAGLYFSGSDTTPENPNWIQRNTPDTSVVVIEKEKKKDVQRILDRSTDQIDTTTQSIILSESDQILSMLEQNPILRIRIQGMSWYRDFLSWKYTSDEIKKHITDALWIEEMIKLDPSILTRMQSWDTWRNYLNGSIPPHNILHWEIAAMLYMDEFSKKNPHIFIQIQRNPMFQRTVDNKEATFSEQRNILEWILAQEKIIQDNPNIRAKLEQYWYTLSSVYSSDWRDGRQSDFFAVNDAIYTLENPKQFDAEVWKQFQNSEIGTQYASGSIDPRIAMRYINDLLINIHQ